jgi:Tol biopolymer transport system component
MRSNWPFTASVYVPGVYRLLLTLSLGAAVLVQAGAAGGKAGHPEWLTFNEVTLTGQKRVLSSHNFFPAASSLSPNNQQLAYVTCLGRGCFPHLNKLMVAEVRRASERLLVEARSEIRDLEWSPDGQTIAFDADGIWLIRSDGSDLRRVADSGVQLAWSPDSTSLAFLRFDNRRPEQRLVTVLSVRTGEERELSAGFRPQWSPDGKSILFEYHPTSVAGSFEIRVIAAGGGPARTIGRGLYPSWSPDGKRIAFIRYERRVSLWIAPIRGGRPRRLARGLGADVFRAGKVPAPAFVWSPNSRQIAFRQSAGFCHSKLSVVRVDGTAPRKLASQTRILSPLAWARGGRKVIYSGERCTGQ